MYKKIDEFIKDLSNVFDPESNDTYISIYINRYNYQKFLDKRIKACRTVLKTDLIINFDETINDIKHVIKNNPKQNLAIFASKKHDFLQHIELTVDIDNILIVDTSPYIRPLARILDEWESFNLLLLNSNSAKIFSILTGKVEDTKTLSAEIINKHKKGGWSQARFNRIRRGAINTFISDVIELLDEKTEEKLIIAGPGETKKLLFDRLPTKLRKKVIDIIDIDINEEYEILKKSMIIVSEKEKKESSLNVQSLKEEILKGGLAVYGIKETLMAAKNGQVELLIIEKDFKKPGWICENCQTVEIGKKTCCPYCGKTTSNVDIIEEIIEFAERTNTKIEFAEDEEIKNLGHIGAILRYK